MLLARALYKNPRLLFLDEATSHLDAAREEQINQAVRQLPLHASSSRTAPARLKRGSGADGRG